MDIEYVSSVDTATMVPSARSLIQIVESFHSHESGFRLFRFVEAPMEEDEFERLPRNNEDDGDEDEIDEERNDARMMVVKRGRKSAGRSGCTWPRQSEAANSSQAAAAGSSVAATHPRGRS